MADDPTDYAAPYVPPPARIAIRGDEQSSANDAHAAVHADQEVCRLLNAFAPFEQLVWSFGPRDWSDHGPLTRGQILAMQIVGLSASFVSVGVRTTGSGREVYLTIGNINVVIESGRDEAARIAQNISSRTRATLAPIRALRLQEASEAVKMQAPPPKLAPQNRFAIMATRQAFVDTQDLDGEAQATLLSTLNRIVEEELAGERDRLSQRLAEAVKAALNA